MIKHIGKTQHPINPKWLAKALGASEVVVVGKLVRTPEDFFALRTKALRILEEKRKAKKKARKK